jgi:hypothetical protein
MRLGGLRDFIGQGLRLLKPEKMSYKGLGDFMND